MNIENSLKMFSSKYGIETAELFTKGRLAINADDGIELECIRANGYIYVSGAVMKLPIEQMQRTELLKKALKANFTLIEEERYSLSIDAEHDQLLVTLAKLQQEIMNDDFEKMVVYVVNNIDFFKRYLDKKNNNMAPTLNRIIP